MTDSRRPATEFKRERSTLKSGYGRIKSALPNLPNEKEKLSQARNAKDENLISLRRAGREGNGEARARLESALCSQH